MANLVIERVHEEFRRVLGTWSYRQSIRNKFNVLHEKPNERGSWFLQVECCMVERGCLKLRAVRDQPKDARKVAKHLSFFKKCVFVPLHVVDAKLFSKERGYAIDLQPVRDYDPTGGQICVIVEYVLPGGDNDVVSFTDVLWPLRGPTTFQSHPLASRATFVEPFIKPYDLRINSNVSDEAVRKIHTLYKKCGGCGKRECLLFKCSNCLMTQYCDVHCQRSSWSKHKQHCQKLALFRKETIHLV
jgi:hypothetical protein